MSCACLFLLVTISADCSFEIVRGWICYKEVLALLVCYMPLVLNKTDRIVDDFVNIVESGTHVAVVMTGCNNNDDNPRTIVWCYHHGRVDSLYSFDCFLHFSMLVLHRY